MEYQAIGIDTASQFYLPDVTHDLSVYDSVPFSEAELRQAEKKKQYLVAVPQVTLKTLRENNQKYFWPKEWAGWESFQRRQNPNYRYADEADWWLNQKFSNKLSRPGYYIVQPYLSVGEDVHYIEKHHKGFQRLSTVEMAYFTITEAFGGSGIGEVITSDTTDDDHVVSVREFMGCAILKRYRYIPPGVGVCSGQYRPLNTQ